MADSPTEPEGAPSKVGGSACHRRGDIISTESKCSTDVERMEEGRKTGALVPYDVRFVPDPSGFQNTGAICYFNALLQTILSCSSIVEATLTGHGYWAPTRLGRVFYDFVWTAVAPACRPEGSRPFGGVLDLAYHPSRVLAELIAALRARRPQFRFGPGQQSASEALVLLVDMLDGEPVLADAAAGIKRVEGVECPIKHLLFHRYRATVHCGLCEGAVSSECDASPQFELFHYDSMRDKPTAPAEFVEKLLRRYTTQLDDYTCEKCERIIPVGLGFREYQLDRIPEVVVVLFNLYDDFRPRSTHYYPQRFDVPALGGGAYVYRQVGQVEHFGALNGGHYIARASRGDGKTYQFNDMAVSPTSFAPTPNVYIVVYHVEKNMSSSPI